MDSYFPLCQIAIWSHDTVFRPVHAENLARPYLSRIVVLLEASLSYIHAALLKVWQLLPKRVRLKI